MVTLFACPKSFHGHTAIIQRNAIESWTRLRPRPEIILMGTDQGVAEICKEFDLVHVENIDRNEYGTPLVNSIFHLGQRQASRPVVCYINSDILLTSDFMRAIESVTARMPQFLILGQRWDIDIKEALNFNSAMWEIELRELVARNGKLHAPSGIDYFCFPKGLYSNIPPFAIGRLKWDNWLVWRARTNGIPVVDITSSTTIVHQNHEYLADKIRKLDTRDNGSTSSEYYSDKIRFDGHWVMAGPEVLRNIALVPEEENLNIWAATWVIKNNDRLERRRLTLSPAYLWYQVKCVLPVYWPTFGRVLRWLRHRVRTLRRYMKQETEGDL